MKKWILPVLSAAMVFTLITPKVVHADEDPLSAEETSAERIKDRPEWQSVLKAHYNLTDEQIKQMQQRG